MKKILSIVLALCMLSTMLVISVGAADGDTLEIVVGDAVVDYDAGEVDVEVYFTSNPGIASITLEFAYDASVMTLTGMANDSDMSMTKNIKKNKAVFDHDDNYADMSLMTLTFELAEGVAAGSYSVTASVPKSGTPINWDMEDIDYVLVNDGVGTVTINPPAPVYPFTAHNVALGEKFAINVKYNATANDVITVTSEGEAVEYIQGNGQITIANIAAKDVDKEYVVTINGFAETFSVGAYCEAQQDSTDAELATIATAVLDYNKAANNYFEGTGEAVEVPHCDVGTDNPRVVANATEGPTFYSVRLQLNDGVYVVVRMKNYTEGDAVTVTIGGAAATYTIGDVNGMDGIFIPVMADQYDADIVITAGNSTLTYSVNTYIQQKQNSSDADLVNLVNALGHYGKAVAAYAAA